jgi:NADH:ubiquinone oxidoreductase subunit F (NADH-binding)/Pyruvate/2-oxoacid:ferredoxin oxidoreductase delta subunit/(2Fe-2S) ferredoxin
MQTKADIADREQVLHILKADPEAPAVKKTLQQWRCEIISQPVISLSATRCADIAGTPAVKAAITAYLQDQTQNAVIRDTGCYGNCALQPMMDVHLPGKAKLSFARVKPESAIEILEAVFAGKVHHPALLGQHPIAGSERWKDVQDFEEQLWMRGQRRRLMALSGHIEPAALTAYIGWGGYSGLHKTVHSLTQDQVAETVADSGLRGRSGSGFPVADKWKPAIETSSEKKYLICNADESDPSCFLARELLESNPHLIIEGIAIAAYAIQADNAILYLKGDYERAMQTLSLALEQAREGGICGNDILGSGFNLHIQVFKSPASFICGEETALIASMEGKRGIPRHKPPFPSVIGFQGKPTVVQNIETLANLPLIFRKGIAWYRECGTPKSTGTKLFSISGKVRWSGVYEIEMGERLRELIFRTAGGMKEGSDFKAALLGGVLGHLLDEENLNLTLDYESMNEAGFALGSGGLSIADQKVCLLDLALFSLDYLAEESCGKCITCREGLRVMRTIVDDILRRSKNESTHQTLERFKGAMQLNDLGTLMQKTALCGLGRNAPNLVMDVQRRFHNEWEEHIFDRQCNAGVCRHLRYFSIKTEACTGCTLCAKKCPDNAISGSPKSPHIIHQDKCTSCGICFEVCRFSAILIS